MLMMLLLCTLSTQELQYLMDSFSTACKNISLTICLKKTVVLSQSPETANFKIDETALEKVNKFKHLGTTVDKNISLDRKLTTRLRTASTTFRRLTKPSWRNKHLMIAKKVRVCEACVLSVLLYGAESWPIYRLQESKISAFYSSPL